MNLNPDTVNAISYMLLLTSCVLNTNRYILIITPWHLLREPPQSHLASGFYMEGFGDCVSKTFAAGGPLKFYTGFPTYYVRIAPHAMLTLILLDNINLFQKSNGM
jgi:hypothetical protein